MTSKEFLLEVQSPGVEDAHQYKEQIEARTSQT